MLLFRILWGVDVIVALIGLAFFVVGIGDGSVSSFNIVLWIVLLGGLAAVVFGSMALRGRGMQGLATAVAGALAVPALLVGVFFIVLIFSGVRWN